MEKSALAAVVILCDVQQERVRLLVGGRQRRRRRRLHVDRAHRVAVDAADEPLRVRAERHDREVVVRRLRPTSSAASSTPITSSFTPLKLTVWPIGLAPPNSCVAVSGPSTITDVRVILVGRVDEPAGADAARPDGPPRRASSRSSVVVQFVELFTSDAEVVDTGATACDVGGDGARLAAPSASCSVSVDAEPKPPRVPVRARRAARARRRGCWCRAR